MTMGLRLTGRHTTVVVPFDGSGLSKSPLVRAAQFDTVLNEDIVAVSILPRINAPSARARGAPPE